MDAPRRDLHLLQVARTWSATRENSRTPTQRRRSPSAHERHALDTTKKKQYDTAARRQTLEKLTPPGRATRNCTERRTPPADPEDRGAALYRCASPPNGTKFIHMSSTDNIHYVNPVCMRTAATLRLSSAPRLFTALLTPVSPALGTAAHADWTQHHLGLKHPVVNAKRCTAESWQCTAGCGVPFSRAGRRAVLSCPGWSRSCDRCVPAGTALRRSART